MRINRTVYIYTLSNPITHEIKYIGKTTNLKSRLKQHLWSALHLKKKTYVNFWIKGLIDNKLEPVIEVLDLCSEDFWEPIEKYWIAQFFAWEFKLTNISEGGGDNSNCLKIPILQYDLDGNFISEWKSIADASCVLGISRGNIGSCCSGSRISSGEYIWKFKNSKPKAKRTFSESTIKKMRESTKIRMKPIIQYDLNKNLIREWESASSVQIELNINRNNIRKCCLGLLNSSGGFIWKYKNNNSPSIEKDNLTKKIRYRVVSKKNKKILQLNLNNEVIKEWESAREISNKLGICYKSISAVCKGHRKTTGGFIWKFKNPELMPKNVYINEKYKVNQYDLENNFINQFTSASNASKATKICRCHINDVCLNKRKTAGGYIWKYLNK